MPLSDRDLLARLVSFDSVSRNSNVPIADFVCEYLERPGVSVERLPGTEDGKVNVVAVAGPADPSGAGLTLSGHLDVVPADEPGWTSDPFVLTQDDGKLVGRGACDMKGSIALAMNVMAVTDPDRLEHPLALLLTCDEEVGTLGAQQFARSWPADRVLPRSVVIGEPTSLRAVRLHKGHLAMRVTVSGKAAHSGSPHLGINAIEHAAKVVQALARLAGQLKQKRCDTSTFFPAVPYPVLAVTRIGGGTALNVIPDKCVLDLGVRVLPGMNTDAMVDWISDTAVKSDPQSSLEIEVLNNSPPMLTQEGAAVNAALCDLIGQKRACGVSFSSDGGPLSQAGYECVLFGPGSIEVAHKPNEFVPIAELTRAKEVLEHLVDRFCS